MGRPALTSQQRSDMRARIRQEALYLYTHGGLDAVSVRAVAQRVGVAASGIYSFFKSRQALIESLWYDPVVETVGEMVRVGAATPDPCERIRSILGIYAAFAERNPEIYRGAFLFVRPDTMVPPQPGNLEDLPYHCLLRDAIIEAQQSGAFHPGDADLLAQALWAGMHGAIAIATNIEHWTFAPRPALVGQMIALLMQGLQR
jgi:AcrR family transcriptional regulator